VRTARVRQQCLFAMPEPVVEISITGLLDPTLMLSSNSSRQPARCVIQAQEVRLYAQGLPPRQKNS